MCAAGEACNKERCWTTRTGWLEMPPSDGPSADDDGALLLGTLEADCPAKDEEGNCRKALLLLRWGLE